MGRAKSSVHRQWIIGVCIFLGLFAGSCAAASTDCTPAPTPPEGFVPAVQRNAPAVVQVVVLRGGRDPMEDARGFEFFQPMQGLPLPGGDAVDRTFSSGFFIDSDGLLLASAHAVFDALEIWVVTASGQRLRATVRGLDRLRDVALLKVEESGMAVVHMERDAAICPGGWVVAIGTPFGFDRTVTAGVISAYPRYLHGSAIPLIQSDVVLNPGSSGGPLFDAAGTLVGMSTMIFSASGIYAGVSFALPVRELKRVAESLKKNGASRSGDIGARTQPLTPDLAQAFGLHSRSGALVLQVEPQGPAARAGVRVGDVIRGLTQEELDARLAAWRPGAVLEVELWRDGALRHARIESVAAVEELPSIAPRRSSNEQRLGLGLTMLMRQLAEQPPGLYIESATGSALLAGLERGDRIVAVNAIPVASPDEFDSALARANPRGVVALLVARGSTLAYVPVISD
jgi:serine protease Do